MRAINMRGDFGSSANSPCLKISDWITARLSGPVSLFGQRLPGSRLCQSGRSEELVEHRQNCNTDDHDYAEFDGELLFHLLDVAFQFGFGYLKLMLQFGLDLLKVGLDLLTRASGDYFATHCAALK